jgi:hypothetical protein
MDIEREGRPGSTAGRPGGCRAGLTKVGSLPRKSKYSGIFVTSRLTPSGGLGFFHNCSLLRSTISGLLVALCEQQITAIPDRNLRDFGKSLQQPGQCHFEPDMIIRDIEMTRRRLPERAHAKHHAIVFPSLFIDLQHGNAGSGARQSSLQPARRFLAAKPMRYRNDKRCGHRNSSADVNACNRAWFERKGTGDYNDPKMELW